MVKNVQGAIIAAGDGARLQPAAGGLPKPLVEVGGEPMLWRQVRVMAAAGIRPIFAIVNTTTFALLESRRLRPSAEMVVSVRDTPNSMESLFALREAMRPEPFFLATVDAVASQSEVDRFKRTVMELQEGTRAAPFDGFLAVSRWNGERRALFAGIADDWLIRDLGEAETEWTTAGLYFFQPQIFNFVAEAQRRKLTALRQLLRASVRAGARLKAIQLHEVIDVDEPADLERARAMCEREKNAGTWQPSGLRLSPPDMTQPTVLGVYREHQFSPGKVEQDGSILDAVLSEFARAGLRPAAVTADHLLDNHGYSFPTLAVAMCQGEKALERLKELERRGAVVVNSSRAIRNCYRDRLGATLADAGIPVPPGLLVRTSAPLELDLIKTFDLTRGVFIKRGDFHALGPSDVQRADSLQAVRAALDEFARRGVLFAYLQQAVGSDVIKFYGVGRGDYFAAYRGIERVSTEPGEELRHVAVRAAQALDLEVWGGDAIVNGREISIVDFNDWPSFAQVRHDAARAIALRCLGLMAEVNGAGKRFLADS